MSSSTNEVDVLGAGFTKAFADDAPLLIGDYETPEVKKFDEFPATLAILKQERKRCPEGKVDLERLMTRLAGGMPYDWSSGSKDLMGALLSALKRSLLDKLHQAKAAGNVRWEKLKLLATHCRKKRITCVTFNYDDFLDQALFETANDPTIAPNPNYYWHLDWGYGFFCNSSFHATGVKRDITLSMAPAINLLKLHGSVNWRVLHGRPVPYATDVITHFEEWSTGPLFGIDPQEYNERAASLLNQYLDPDPFIVPPVLTKSDLVEHPVLRVIWSRAFKCLQEANKVTFVGYSLPITDIAAGTLFRESLDRLDVCNIKVVDRATVANKAKKEKQVLENYGKVFPGITAEQIDLRGGLAWAEEVCAGGSQG